MIYLVAYRKDAHGPAWLLSEAADVEDVGQLDIVRCPLVKTAMRTVIYFEAPDLDAARRVLELMMNGEPKLIPRDPLSLHPVCTWQELQSRFPKELRDVQAQAEERPRPQALRLLRADAGGRAR